LTTWFRNLGFIAITLPLQPMGLYHELSSNCSEQVLAMFHETSSPHPLGLLTCTALLPWCRPYIAAVDCRPSGTQELEIAEFHGKNGVSVAPVLTAIKYQTQDHWAGKGEYSFCPWVISVPGFRICGEKDFEIQVYSSPTVNLGRVRSHQSVNWCDIRFNPVGVPALPAEAVVMFSDA
jgi:hypothetical protein